MIYRVILFLALGFYTVMLAQSAYVLVLTLPVYLLALAASLRNRNENFDPVDMFWLMAVLLFVVTPTRNFFSIEGDPFFRQGVYMESVFGQVYSYDRNHLIVLSLAVAAFHFSFFLILPKYYRFQGRQNVSLPVNTTVLLGLFVMSFLAVVVLSGGLQNALMPRFLKDRAVESQFLIVAKALLLSLSLIGISSSLKAEGLQNRVYLLLYLLLLTLIFNPFNTSRFSLILAWLPVFLMIFPVLLRVQYFSAILFFGIAVLMPLLSITTRFGLGSDISRARIDGAGFFQYLDSSKILLHLVDMIERNGYLFGESTMSVVLFFVPRALWPEKPVVQGLLVGEELYSWGMFGTENLSGPLVGDFLWDFGLPGVILGSIAAAFVVRWIFRKGHLLNGQNVYAYILMSQIPILARGSVGAVIAIPFFTLVFYYFFVLLLPRVRMKMGR